MLSVFEISQTRETKWYKLLAQSIFGVSPDGSLELIENVPYIKIVSREGKNGLPWRRISDISLDCSGRMLMPTDVFPPEGCGVVRFVPEEYPAKMLEKLAFAVTRNAMLDPSELSVAVCGNAILVQRVLPQVIDLAADIRVISDEARSLADFIDGTVELTGASIMLSDDISVADGCDAVIAPDGISPDFKGNERSVLFAPKRCLCFGIQVTRADIEIPEWLAPAYRDFYDKLEFLSAFYEISRVRRLEELEPLGGVGTYGHMTLDSIVDFLKIRK